MNDIGSVITNVYNKIQGAFVYILKNHLIGSFVNSDSSDERVLIFTGTFDDVKERRSITVSRMRISKLIDGEEEHPQVDAKQTLTLISNVGEEREYYSEIVFEGISTDGVEFHKFDETKKVVDLSFSDMVTLSEAADLVLNSTSWFRWEGNQRVGVSVPVEQVEDAELIDFTETSSGKFFNEVVDKIREFFKAVNETRKDFKDGCLLESDHEEDEDFIILCVKPYRFDGYDITRAILINSNGRTEGEFDIQFGTKGSDPNEDVCYVYRVNDHQYQEPVSLSELPFEELQSLIDSFDNIDKHKYSGCNLVEAKKDLEELMSE